MCYIPSMDTYRIGELADLTGISPRMTRHYVKIGLIQSPIGKGRGARYPEEAMARLKEIRNLRNKGMRAPGMRRELGVLRSETWTVYHLRPGLEIHISSEESKRHPDEIATLVKLYSLTQQV